MLLIEMRIEARIHANVLVLPSSGANHYVTLSLLYPV